MTLIKASVFSTVKLAAFTLLVSMIVAAAYVIYTYSFKAT